MKAHIDFSAFVRERDEAFLSFDREKIEAYCKKYMVQIPQNDKVFWMGICEAVQNISSATAEQKKHAAEMYQDLQAHSTVYAKRFNQK